MTTVKLSVYVDIESAINDAIEAVSLTGMGADGSSEYEITDVSLAPDGTGGYEVTVTCDRIEGKFVGKDEIGEMISGEVESLDVTVDVSMV